MRPDRRDRQQQVEASRERERDREQIPVACGEGPEDTVQQHVLPARHAMAALRDRLAPGDDREGARHAEADRHQGRQPRELTGVRQPPCDSGQQRDRDQRVAGHVERMPEIRCRAAAARQLAVGAVEHTGCDQTEEAEQQGEAGAADEQPADDSDGSAGNGDRIRRDRRAEQPARQRVRERAMEEPVDVAVARVGVRTIRRGHARARESSRAILGSTSRSARTTSPGKSISIHGSPSTRSKPTSTWPSSSG